jgi:hypothetical protein
MAATLEVEVTASRYFSESNGTFATDKAIVAVQTNTGIVELIESVPTNTLDLESNIASITLAEEVAWNTYKVTLSNVFKGNRLAFGAAKNVSGNDARMNISDIKVKIAERKSDIEVLKDALTLRSEDLKAKKQELAGIVDATAPQEEKLRAVREACAAKIDARTMSAYERIRRSVHNHLAVVSVYNGDSCGGCFNTITPQRLVEIASNKKLIICEHCGRIIVNPDFE